MNELSDAAIDQALERVGTRALLNGFSSLVARFPASDWDHNFLAAAFGQPGSLRSAVDTRAEFFRGRRLHEWDTELLDVVADVTGWGRDAFLFHRLNINNPQRLAELCAAALSRLTGEPVAWPLPPSPPPLSGIPSEVRLVAARYLSSKIDQSSRSSFIEAINAIGLLTWAPQHHFDIGLSVRNILREAGITESSLGIASFDDEWADLFSEALNIEEA